MEKLNKIEKVYCTWTWWYDKIKKQYSAGRLTVRESVSYLPDKDSFNEVGILSGESSYDSYGNSKT